MRLAGRRTPEQWADLIRSKWQDNVKGIFDVGLLLFNAREELKAPAFWTMVRGKLNFSKTVVSQLTRVATDPKLLEVCHDKLPASYNTLYALVLLSEEQFDHGLESGVIHAGMERKDIALLKPPKEEAEVRTPLLEVPPESPMDLNIEGGRGAIAPIDRCTMAVRHAVMTIMSELPEDQWSVLLAALRDELDDVERVAQSRKAA